MFPDIDYSQNPLYDMLQALDPRIRPKKVLKKELGIRLDYKQEVQNVRPFRVVISMDTDKNTRRKNVCGLVLVVRRICVDDFRIPE